MYVPVIQTIEATQAPVAAHALILNGAQYRPRNTLCPPQPPPIVHNKSWRSHTCHVGRADGVTGPVVASNRTMTFEQ